MFVSIFYNHNLPISKRNVVRSISGAGGNPALTFRSMLHLFKTNLAGGIFRGLSALGAWFPLQNLAGLLACWLPGAVLAVGGFAGWRRGGWLGWLGSCLVDARLAVARFAG